MDTPRNVNAPRPKSLGGRGRGSMMCSQMGMEWLVTHFRRNEAERLRRKEDELMRKDEELIYIY